MKPLHALALGVGLMASPACDKKPKKPNPCLEVADEISLQFEDAFEDLDDDNKVAFCARAESVFLKATVIRVGKQATACNKAQLSNIDSYIQSQHHKVAMLCPDLFNY